MELKQNNVFGMALESCCTEPLTGFFRDGKCHTGPEDIGRHTVCAIMTDEFLEFSKSRGNDLSTPRADWGFKGLLPGDKWCLCASRWKEAYNAGKAPQIILEATNEQVLDQISMDILLEHAFKKNK
ncbi:MAG: DUF2237 family protein [Bacteroidetes bacterium]|jgi:uncharacterized protein (DUF2237 family)|nr:DUF2237 family protein [Bacteroidota bacterium]